MVLLLSFVTLALLCPRRRRFKRCRGIIINSNVSFGTLHLPGARGRGGEGRGTRRALLSEHPKIRSIIHRRRRGLSPRRRPSPRRPDGCCGGESLGLVNMEDVQSIMGIGDAGFYCPDQPIPVMGGPKLLRHYCTLGTLACEIWTCDAALDE